MFLIELLPYCIKEHPWGNRKIREALDNLEIEEYDKLMEALTETMKGQETAKKSETQS